MIIKELEEEVEESVDLCKFCEIPFREDDCCSKCGAVKRDGNIKGTEWMKPQKDPLTTYEEDYRGTVGCTFHVYRCPYCMEEYDDEYDARDCARDCVDVDPPDEIDKDLYECEYCGHQSQNYGSIDECEKKHLETKDKHWEEFKRNKSFEKLALTANTKG
jgi:hypothetical protein